MQRPNSNSFSRGVTILLVLQHRVVRRLLGEAVLQLEREHRQPVDEQPDVQRPLRLVPAVPKLPGNREPVLREPFLRLRIVLRRRAVEQIQLQRPVSDPVAQPRRSCRAWQSRPAAESGTRAVSDRPRKAPTSRRPPAACPAGTPRAVPGRHSAPGRSRGSCPRSTPPRRTRRADPPRCPQPADRTGVPPAPCRSTAPAHVRSCL